MRSATSIRSSGKLIIRSLRTGSTLFLALMFMLSFADLAIRL
jgi:hypothetical protein